MKRLVVILALLSSLSLYAADGYFPDPRIEKFACVVARSIKEAYPRQTLRKIRQDVLKHLQEDINPWVDAYPIPAGFSLPRYLERITGLPGFPMDRSEYYMQNAFILFGNPRMELKVPTENYFASFIHLARKRHIDYLNKKSPRFQLRNEKDLFQQIEANLPSVADYSFVYLDESGKPIRQEGPMKNENNRYQLAIGNPGHSKYEEFVYETQRYNHFVSPLFVWLLEQKDFSITPEKLFEKAVEIYGDPMVALGVIPWIFSGDALTVSRETSSVVSYKMERLVEGGDIAGYQYHFWGYITQAIIGNRIRVETLAYIYEKLYQKDIPDWKVDLMALKLGEQVRTYFNNQKRCNEAR